MFASRNHIQAPQLISSRSRCTETGRIVPAGGSFRASSSDEFKLVIDGRNFVQIVHENRNCAGKIKRNLNHVVNIYPFSGPIPCNGG